MRLYTLGYGSRSKDECVALLRERSIRTVVDVRLRPDRASMGVWVKAGTPDKGVERWLGDAGIGYRSLVELGNLFLDFDDWRERYRRLLEGAGELLTERLRSVNGPICLLCAEKRPEECHRTLIAEFLARKDGVEVEHIG
jgi:uncharacterized protein (DUF488 family)